MPQQTDEFRAYAVHLAAEHRRIADFLREIEQHFQLARADSGSELVTVLESLRKLRTELSIHFDEEESGGCLEEAVIHDPALAPDANRVMDEHSQLLAEVDRMIERLGALQGSADSLEELKAGFRNFVKRLRAHKRAENRILQSSFGIDVP